MTNILDMKRVAPQLIMKELNFVLCCGRVLSKNATNVVEQALNSSYMTPCDFILFPRIKLPLRGRRSESVEDIKGNLLKEPQSAYEKCMKYWAVKYWAIAVLNSTGPSLKTTKQILLKE